MNNTLNTRFPGRGDYTGPTTGWFGLLHHEVLFEYSHNVMERVEYIVQHKPSHEVATRLHNLIWIDPKECRAVLDRKPLDDKYQADCKPLDAAILAYIKKYVPDCAWNGGGGWYSDRKTSI